MPNRADVIGLGLVMERPNPRSPTAAPCNSRSPVVGAGIWKAQPVGDAAGPPWRRKWAWRRSTATAPPPCRVRVKRDGERKERKSSGLVA